MEWDKYKVPLPKKSKLTKILDSSELDFGGDGDVSESKVSTKRVKVPVSYTHLSGAILVGGQFVVGRIKGIKRAPLGAVMPTAKGPMLLVDAGANMDAKAEYLLQFAQMGSIYMEDVLGIKNPRVGLVNVGVEAVSYTHLIKDYLIC